MQDHAKSLTSIFSLLETGPAQLLSYSIKQITWGNIKMVIKYRVEELDDVYWAQARTMLFEGLHKVNLEIIKHRVISISSRMMLISDLFSSCPCHFLTSIQIQLLMHLAIHSCKWATPPLAHQDIIMHEGPLLHSQMMTYVAPVYELVKENVPSVFTFTPLSLAVPTAFPLLASYFRLAQLISCYPQRVCSCLPNPSYSRLHSFAPCFIFISGSPDCPHSEGTQLTSAPNNNYHPGYLSRKILAVDGEILHLSMCTAPSKTVGHKCS